MQKRFINSEHIGSYVELGSQRLHYLEQGEGEPLILVHTIGQSLYTWRKMIDALSTRHRVFALDLFGHGYSDKPNGDYIIDDHSAIILQFMDALDIPVAHFMAFSMGALYALDFAQKYPERSARLVLISPGGITPTMPGFVRGLASGALGWLYGLFISEKRTAALLSSCFFDQTMITDEVIHEYYYVNTTPGSRNALQSCLRNFDDEEVIQRLRDVDNEILILWGRDDRWHELEISEVFSIALKHMHLEPILNCGHIIQEEKPERILEYAIPFYQYGLR